MKSTILGGRVGALAAALLATSVGTSYGAMVLTGNVPGLTLQTFADGIQQTPNSPFGIGAMGVTFDSQRVYVSEFGNGKVYAFPSHAVGQHAGDAAVLTSGSFGANALIGLANLNNHIYVASDAYSNVGELTLGTPITHAQKAYAQNAKALVASDILGKLYVSTANTTVEGSPVPPQVLEFDGASLVSGTVVSRNFAARGSSFPDALALSGDQSILYVLWDDGHLISYSTTVNDGSVAQQLADIFTIPGVGTGGNFGSLDGLIAGTGGFEGQFFLNRNDGNLIKINPAGASPAEQFVTVATGGTYGGNLATDPTDGSLFITQSDSVLRLTAPQGSGFGATNFPAVPEPASLGLLAAGSLLLLKRKTA